MATKAWVYCVHILYYIVLYCIVLLIQDVLHPSNIIIHFLLCNLANPPPYSIYLLQFTSVYFSLPRLWTYYTLYTVHYALYTQCTIRYTLYAMYYTLCAIHYTLCTMHYIHYALYAIYTVRYALYIHCIVEKTCPVISGWRSTAPWCSGISERGSTCAMMSSWWVVFSLYTYLSPSYTYLSPSYTYLSPSYTYYTYLSLYYTILYTMLYYILYYILYYTPQNSLTKSQPIDQNETSGKSGARFFLSEDKLYIIKTVTSEEVEAVHALLAEYHQVF